MPQRARKNRLLYEMTSTRKKKWNTNMQGNKWNC